MLKVALALLGVVAIPADADTLFAKRLDGTDIQISVERPASDRPVPILLAVDGSLCAPEKYSEWINWLASKRNGATPYALVVVEKPSPTVPKLTANGSYDIGPDFQCSEGFKQHYTIDQRVLDHLQALAYLRKTSPSWWNGRLLIWGFSDGAHIGARVGLYSPETKAELLVGLGGGTTMAFQLEHSMCSEPNNAKQCRRDFRAKADEVRTNPTTNKSWLGEANTYAAWQSRLDTVETNALQYATFPVLVIHGVKDGSVPVESARALAKVLSRPSGSVEYWEIDGMGHGLGSLDAQKGAQLQARSLEWLLQHEGQ